MNGKEPTNLSDLKDQIFTPTPLNVKGRAMSVVVERRRDKRKRVEVLGWITSPGKGRPCCIVCQDLTHEGAQFTAPVRIVTTESIHMSLQLHPAGGPLECDGDVCWSRMMDDGYCHFGVRFRDLAESHGTRLGLFLQSN